MAKFAEFPLHALALNSPRGRSDRPGCSGRGMPVSSAIMRPLHRLRGSTCCGACCGAGWICRDPPEPGTQRAPLVGGWALGLLVAGGAFAGYVISRTVGVLSVVVEGLFVGLYLAIGRWMNTPQKIVCLRDTPTSVTSV